jgi:hypothetical protein
VVTCGDSAMVDTLRVWDMLNRLLNGLLNGLLDGLDKRALAIVYRKALRGTYPVDRSHPLREGSHDRVEFSIAPP